jgi:hypothetical protein
LSNNKYLGNDGAAERREIQLMYIRIKYINMHLQNVTEILPSHGNDLKKRINRWVCSRKKKNTCQPPNPNPVTIETKTENRIVSGIPDGVIDNTPADPDAAGLPVFSST